MNKFKIMQIQAILDYKCNQLNKNRINSSQSDCEINQDIEDIKQLSNDLTEMFNEYRDLLGENL